MKDLRVRLLSEPGEPWVVELAREYDELLLNTDALGLAQAEREDVRDGAGAVGAALLWFLREHPLAGNEELTGVALVSSAAWRQERAARDGSKEEKDFPVERYSGSA